MILRFIGLAIIGVLLAVTIKQHRPEQGVMLSIAVVCVMTFFAAAALAGVIEYARGLAADINMDGAILGVLLKTLCVSVIIRITGGLCRDAHESGIATALETGGAILIVYISLPLFNMVYELIRSLLRS